MPLPRATYRIQFNLNFRFRDAEELVPYLHALGSRLDAGNSP